jgi:hypothetical protein
MPIQTKIGVLTQLPGETLPQPGLIDNIYAKYLTKELDFLDDASNRPLASDFTSDPLVHINSSDWEDLATVYRAWRDSYIKEQNEYWIYRVWKDELFFRNWVQDPVPGGGNPYEFLRITFPSREGEFNLPYPNPIGSEHYSFYNSRRNLYEDYTRYKMDPRALMEQFGSNELTMHLTTYVDPMGEPVYDENGELTGYNEVTIEAEVEEIFMLYRSRRDRMIFLIVYQGHYGQKSNSEIVELANLKTFFENFDKASFMEMVSPLELSSTWLSERFPDGIPSWYEWVNNIPQFAKELFEGVSSWNVLEPIDNLSKLPATGNPGDVVRVVSGENGWDWVIWNPVTSSWTSEAVNMFQDFDTFDRARRDARLKAKNELALAMRPFIFASLDIPAFQLTVDSTLEGDLRSFPSIA